MVLVPAEGRLGPVRLGAVFARVGPHLHVYRNHVFAHAPDHGEDFAADPAGLVG